MPRPIRPVLVALPLLALLAGCGASEATQGSVRDDVRDALLARRGNELSSSDAEQVGVCVAAGMFESSDFTKEEREAATRSVDGDAPDEELMAKVEDLVTGCLDEVEES